MCETETGRAQPMTWGDTNVQISTGLTRQQYIERQQQCYDRLEKECKWTQVNKSSRVRNACEALALLASDHFDSPRVIGLSTMHHSLVDKSEITQADEPNEWGIREGEPFIVMDSSHSRSGYKSDDGNMANWPMVVENVSLGGIWGFFFTDGLLAHSRYSSMATIISGEGCHSSLVKRESRKQMSDLSLLEKLVFWSNIHQCWMCLRHSNKCCFDWVFESAVSGLMGHSGNHCLHGITQMFEGNPYAIPFNIGLLKKIFLEDIDPSNYNIDYEEWRTNKKSGFVLTTPEIHDYEKNLFYEKYLEKLQEAQSQKKLHLFNNAEYRRKICCEIANSESICVVEHNPYPWRYNLSTDYFHCFCSYNLYQLKVLGLEMHSVNKFSMEDSTTCIKDMGIKFVTKSYEKYLTNNRSANLDKDWNFTSNGHGYKMICSQLGFAQTEAGWVEHKNLETKLSDISVANVIEGDYANVDLSLFLPTLKLAAQYCAHKWLRRAWGGIWSSTTEVGIDGSLSESVKEIKHNFRKGFNMLITFSQETVCLIQYFSI